MWKSGKREEACRVSDAVSIRMACDVDDMKPLPLAADHAAGVTAEGCSGRSEFEPRISGMWFFKQV
jgi:hypothetical protein